MTDVARVPHAEARPGTWVVVPAFNEGPVVGGVVRELVTAGWPVVVVDDGSSDATGQRALEAGAVVLRHVVNLGQGAALQTGIEFAWRQGAARVVTFDADGQHSSDSIPLLLAALDGGADLALGSRFLGRVEGASKRRKALLRLAASVSNKLSGLSLTDSHCGLRAFHRDVAAPLRMHQSGMAHASEILRHAARARLHVVEVPVTIRYTDYSIRKGQRASQALRILFDYFARA
ncbi:glycosyltransferase family 2 protein [Aggregicoccus sp. 17bor-14]|uniref:glycosyltransferase family 2 protein n=1 Tax=Myxococcaceae TaxID=31 RepID=UPI00129D17BC|nr:MULTISPECIES: glycosyltransferase family 2 protein [Myxococcaceae]MBF5044745.1 glycosyltransferase family 2 protein [Simulacricoccus sp. 17bor-14]MRI90489.1 glycosyltransferase family 2 protein [Aggregicoccus sp. 17bor-14]